MGASRSQTVTAIARMATSIASWQKKCYKGRRTATLDRLTPFSTPKVPMTLFRKALQLSVGLAMLWGQVPIAIAQTPTPEVETPETTEEPTPSVSDIELSGTEKTPDPEKADYHLLLEADRLFLQGNLEAAEELYRQVKPPFSEDLVEFSDRPEAIVDPENLSPGGQVYWREAQRGIEQGLESGIFIPLELLTQEYPEFIPAYIELADLLREYDRFEEALDLLERGANLYPDQPDLVRAQIDILDENEQWLEASIAARQFALLYPEHPRAEEFSQLAEQHLERFQRRLRARLRENAIASVVTGAVGVAITGTPFAAISTVQMSILMLQGESKLGANVAESIIESDEIELVSDEQVVTYVDNLGQRLADLTGRDFDYEFYIILDPELNAFALPGGKIFINAGAIAKARSEAELAGLIAHELAHAVLSHGFQRLAEATLVGNVARFVPFGGTIGTLLVLDYSRDQERQADVMGTRILVSAGYAADGLRNLMATIEAESGGRSVPTWLSTHPHPERRVRYLEELIVENGYNRYAYEGVEPFWQVRDRVSQLLANPDELELETDEPEEEPEELLEPEPFPEWRGFGGGW